MNGFSRFSFSQSLIGIIILITILFLYQLDIKSHMHLNINFFNNACASNPICNAIGKWCKIEPLVHLTPLPPRERYNQPSYDIMYNRDKYLANLEMTQNPPPPQDSIGISGISPFPFGTLIFPFRSLSELLGVCRNFGNFRLSLWKINFMGLDWSVTTTVGYP